MALALLLTGGVRAQTSSASTSVPATAVPLTLPAAVAFDSASNLYFAETGHHLIRKVTAGILSTVAGSGVQGYSGDGSSAVSAALDSPTGIAVDSAGDLYVADTHNQRVRQVSATTGNITTVAGTGTAGFSGDTGPATAAQLRNPGALAFSPAGDLYIADTGNHRIRQLNLATGRITTVAGNGLQLFAGDNGPATAASIDSPTGLSVDAGGRLYIADTHNQRIRVVDPSSGLIRTVSGTGTPGASGDGGSATTATMSMPRGLTSDAAGNLYVTDSENHRIRRIDAITGIISTVAGDGVEQFAGDGGAAVAASLATPHAVAFSPDGRLTVADTGNSRVRQLTGPVQPATTIQTVAGLGKTTPGVLTLAAPSVVAYGSGTLTAALLAGTPATGRVSFLETTSSGVTLLGTAPLSSNSAALGLAVLPAGQHHLTATYPGDTTHTAAQSTSLLLTVSPLQLTVTPTSASIFFGQTPPLLSGSVSGLLPQDVATVSLAFTSPVNAGSPPGTYPITVTLSGAGAGNYTATSAATSLVVNRAPVLIALSDIPGVALGSFTFSAKVASTTSGRPTGTITFLDTLLPVAAVMLDASGLSSWTTSSFTSGSHSLTAVYSGDTDFTAATSAASVVTVSAPVSTAPAADFAITPTGITSQTVQVGAAARYTFSVQLQGSALASPITLAANGLPPLATASFNPEYIPPGGAVSSFTVTIATPKTASRAVDPRPEGPSWLPWIATLAVLLPFVGRRLHQPRDLRRLSLAAAILLTAPLILLVGCGDRVAGLANGTSSLKTYTLAITGTATTASGSILQHAATVTLNVQ